MKEIKTTQGKVCLVDDDMAEQFESRRWCLSGGYAARRCTGENGSHLVYIHREVMPCGPNEVLVHLDGNKLNCQRDNLFKTTRGHAQQRNKARSASGFKGVSQQRGRWVAHIGVAGKTQHLGCFVEKIDAARAYDAHAFKVYGERAVLNFSDADSVECYRRQAHPTATP